MSSPQLPLRPNVCMLVYNKDKKIFVGERINKPGVWQLPQGGVEPHTTQEESVYRELEEEIGVSKIHLDIPRKLTATHSYDFDTTPKYARGVWRGQDQTFWAVEFIGEDRDIILDKHEEPEFRAWMWCDLAQVLHQVEFRRRAGYVAALEELKTFFGK